MDTRQQIRSAEVKVANAIMLLHALYKPASGNVYDKQGIYTVNILENKLPMAVKKLLPNQGKDGITLHFYRPGYIQGPPIRYMMEQKIRSLCLAAINECADTNPEKVVEIANVCRRLIAGIDLGTLTQENFAERAEQLMTHACEQTGVALYKILSETSYAKDATSFIAKIIKDSAHLCSNLSSTLTFDNATKRVSFDEVISSVTSHDRGMNKHVANLSCVYEGSFDDKAVKIASSIIKHAALPPIDQISSTRLTDLYESDIDIIVATCNHIEEVATSMAALRRHGSDSQDPLTLDWTYQLLTTNAFNVEKQASTYGYTISAVNLMQGVQLNGDITLKMHVFNAGINSLADWNFGQKADTQRQENRKAYINLTQNFINHMPDSTGLIKRVKDAYGFPQTSELFEQYDSLNRNLITNAKRFNELRIKYNKESNVMRRKVLKARMRACLELAKEINTDISYVTADIEAAQKSAWLQNKEKVKKELDDLRQSAGVSQLKEWLAVGDPRGEAAAKVIRNVSAVFYKAYMDELYYTGAYREPGKAAIFNAYMSAYQRLMGMSASTGCKSANDRTYVARLLLAAIEGRDLASFPLPPNYTHDVDAYFLLKGSLDKIAMTNTAMFTPINDTNGGAPKVDDRKFKILNLVSGLKIVNKLGSFAAHKMKSSGLLKAITQAINHVRKSISAGLTHSSLFASKNETRSEPSSVPSPRPPRASH